MKQDTPGSNKYTPVTFTAAAGNEVLVTDEWVEGMGELLSQAKVTDKITDEVYRFVLVDTDEEEYAFFRWLRRINERCYVKTNLYSPMDYVPKDEDERFEEFVDTIENAKMEMVMAIGLFPRYDLEADWMDQSHYDYLRETQSRVDDADPDVVETTRRNLFGTLKPF